MDIDRGGGGKGQVEEGIYVMVYGRGKAVDGEPELMRMLEVSLDFKPDALRRIARFVNQMADEIEAAQMRTDHRHLSEIDRAWARDFPDFDMIVLHS